MGRKSIGLQLTGEWWEGMRDSVRLMGDKLPRRMTDLQGLAASATRGRPFRSEDKCESTVIASPASLTLSPVVSQFNATEDTASTSSGSSSFTSFTASSSSASSRLSVILLPRLEDTVRSVKKDLVRLRSKSCDRLLRRRRLQRRSGVEDWGGGGSPRAASPELVEQVRAPAPSPRQYDEEYFQYNDTLRKSRRRAERSKIISYRGPYVGVARAKVSFVPSPYDNQALKFKAGDLIHIIRKHASGIWEGECAGQVGRFKFINVEELEDWPHATSAGHPPTATPSGSLSGDQLTEEAEVESTVNGLLARLGLSDLTSRLVLHGWDTVSRLQQLARTDLEYLGVVDRAQQDRLLSAVAVLKDRQRVEQEAPVAAADSLGQGRNRDRPVSRMDSGYYDGPRDSESEDLDSGSSGTGSTASSSCGTGSMASSSCGTESTASSSCGTGSIASSSCGTESTASSSCGTGSTASSDSLVQLMEAMWPQPRSDDVTGHVATHPEEPSPRHLRSPLAAACAQLFSPSRTTAVAVGDSSLSLAEPTILLDSSF